jgi:hypothetical protein
LVGFKNGELYNLDNRTAFWLFYRPDSMHSTDCKLFYPNLPNLDHAGLNLWCLGKSVPVIKLTDPTWSVKIMDYFWQSAFIDSGLNAYWLWAVKNIPESFRKKYSKIAWKDIAGFRDILSHAYFGLNLERVWNIIENDIPILKKEIEKIKLESL